MTTSPSARWELVPHFLLRRAGFPFSQLEAVAAPRSSALAAEWAALRAEARQERDAMLRTTFPAEVKRLAARGDRTALKRLSRWRRQVGHGRPGPAPEGDFGVALREGHGRWQSLTARAALLRAALEEALATETRTARGNLRRAFLPPQMREALFLMSAHFLESAGPALDALPSEAPTSHERALELRLYAFLQRLAAKNETTSFFGPLAYGQVTDGPEPLRLGPEFPGGVRRREAFTAFWAAVALGRAASADPAIRAELPLRRVPVIIRSGTEVTRADGKVVALDPLSARLLDGAEAGATVVELARGLELERAQVELGVQQLERAGLVRRELEPSSTVARPLEDVLAQLPHTDAAATWRGELERYRGFEADFAVGDVAAKQRALAGAEAHFFKVTGQEPRRAAGEFYADRMLLYEDCLGDLQPVELSRTEATRLSAAVAPALELGAQLGALRTQAVRALATQVVEEAGRPLPFLHFAELLEAKIKSGALEPLLAPARALVAGLAALVAERSDGHVSRVSAALLAERLGLSPLPGPRFASPDVMLDVSGAGPRYVLGEVHPYVFAWGSQNYFAPEPEALAAAFREDLSPWGGPERMAMVLRRRRHKGLVSRMFPGTFIEVSGRSVEDPAQRLAVGELWVERGATGAELLGPQGPLTLYAGEDDHAHLRAFAPPPVELPPLRTGAHTARFELGDCVVQRERWELSPELGMPVLAARTGAGLMLAVAELKHTLGLPRHVFVLCPSETKPLCLDLDGTLAQQWLQRWLRLGPVSVVEMLPAPGGLWVHRSDGLYTSELRMALVHRP